MNRLAETFKTDSHPKLIKALTYLAWFGVLYLLFILVYSLFYWYFVSRLQTQFIDHIFWWLKNTGIWYFFAPVCLVTFTRFAEQQKFIVTAYRLGIPMVVFAVILQITFDYSYLKEDLTGYFVLFLPRQVGIFIVVCLYWYLAVMDKALAEPKYRVSNSLEPDSLDIDAPSQKNKDLVDKQYLELEHMGRPYRLDMSSVWMIKSAGNYLELESEHGHFLKRISLKQIQLEIPQYFCQCHRSSIINLYHVCAIRNQSSGHAVATMSNGEQVNISKRYKSIVKQRLVEFPLQTS
jgi:hypothetical protein